MPATAEVPLRCMPRIATRVTESGAAGSASLERSLGAAKPVSDRLAEARRELLQLRQVELGQVRLEALRDVGRVLPRCVHLPGNARGDVGLTVRDAEEAVEPQQQVPRILLDLVEEADEDLVAAEAPLPDLERTDVVGAQHVRLA